MHVGKLSIGKDGKTYRSTVEKNFCDKFLYERYEYEYEKTYVATRKFTCDFYLPKFKLWIEVVPADERKHIKRTEKIIPDKVYLNVSYSDKRIAKANGAKWDPDLKKWYISKLDVDLWSRSPMLRNFLPKFQEQLIEIEETPETLGFKNYFEVIEHKKYMVQELGESFITIYDDDLGHESLIHCLMSKDTSTFNQTTLLRLARYWELKSNQ